MPRDHKDADSLYRDPVYGPMLRTAHYYAAQMGLCPEDCEDCAMEFLLRQVQVYGDAKVATVPPALRRRSASNHVKNTLRSRAARQQYEQESLLSPVRDTALELPEQAALRRAFWETVSPFFQRLPSASGVLLITYLENEMSVQELAEALGEKINTVEQRLLRARKRLRQILEAEGISATDMQEYLKIPSQNIFEDARKDVSL